MNTPSPSAVRPLHVLHVASGDLWGGAESQLSALARAQRKSAGLDVSAVILNPGRLEQELIDSGVRVTVLDESNLGTPAILRNMIGLLRDEQPDIIHTHRLKENVLGSIAGRIAGRIPSLRTEHGAPEHQAPWYAAHKLAIAWLDRWCGRHLQSAIVAVSDDLRKKLEPIYRSRTVTISNGIDVDAMRRDADSSRPDFLNDDRFKIGFLGRLVAVKRVDVLLRSFREFARNAGTDSILHIVGDGPMRRELEALATTLEIHDQVSFHGHRDDGAAIIAGLDALVLCSDHEGLPMVVLEALAVETPVVAHAVGGIPDALDAGNCGILVDEQDPARIATAIRDLRTDPGQRRQMTQAGLQRVVSRYSIDATASEYSRLYRQKSG